MQKMPERRARILDFVSRYIEENAYPPSVREIGRAVGISSTSVVDFHLRSLENDGYIRRAREVSRGIEVLGGSGAGAFSQVPIVGTIAAGLPIEAVTTEADTIPLPGTLVDTADPEELYALHVKGDSMIDELIGDGDLVICRRQTTAQDGDIVVALLTNTPTEQWGATLKRFYREGDRIRLQPANPTMAPIYASPREVRIQGKVVALIRRF